jgi:ribonuclease BN (tRNA processing enzyme)
MKPAKAALLAFVLLAVASAQSANHYDKVKVADGIYAFIAPEGKTGFVSSNQTAIIGDDGVLIFDTGQIPSLSEKIIAELKQITPLPVKYIVISHWHYDHVMVPPPTSRHFRARSSSPQIRHVSRSSPRRRISGHRTPSRSSRNI